MGENLARVLGILWPDQDVVRTEAAQPPARCARHRRRPNLPLRHVAVGEPNKQIARELGISERTARTHVSRILRKLNLSSRTQAALFAVREGLVMLVAR